MPGARWVPEFIGSGQSSAAMDSRIHTGFPGWMWQFIAGVGVPARLDVAIHRGLPGEAPGWSAQPGGRAQPRPGLSPAGAGPRSAGEALDMVTAGLGWLAAADLAGMRPGRGPSAPLKLGPGRNAIRTH